VPDRTLPRPSVSAASSVNTIDLKLENPQGLFKKYLLYLADFSPSKTVEILTYRELKLCK